MDVEADKQDQVAAQDGGAVKASDLGAVASAVVGQPRPEQVSVELVQGKVDGKQVQDELGDLEQGDVLFPPDPDASGGEEVVKVHDNVDGQVQGDWDPLDGGVALELGVAEQGGGAVVVCVQEQELLALEDKEAGVDQLDKLDQVVDVVQDDQLVGVGVGAADAVVEAVLPNDREDLLKDEQQEDEGGGGQEQVVDLERDAELEGADVELCGDGWVAKDDDVVD